MDGTQMLVDKLSGKLTKKSTLKTVYTLKVDDTDWNKIFNQPDKTTWNIHTEPCHLCFTGMINNKISFNQIIDTTKSMSTYEALKQMIIQYLKNSGYKVTTDCWIDYLTKNEVFIKWRETVVE